MVIRLLPGQSNGFNLVVFGAIRHNPSSVGEVLGGAVEGQAVDHRLDDDATTHELADCVVTSA